MPAFDVSEGYVVLANTQYYLVMTTFDELETLEYEITLVGDFVFGMLAPPPPPPTVPISNWVFALIGLFAVGFVIIRFKK